MTFDFIFQSDSYIAFEKALIDLAISLKVYVDLHPFYSYYLLEAPKYDEV